MMNPTPRRHRTSKTEHPCFICKYLMSLTTAGWYTKPLYAAVRDGDVNTLIDLLDNGSDANTCNLSGVSILHLACSQGHDKIVSVLLSRGANVNSCLIYDFTPLHVAVLKGFWDCIKILIQHGADVNHRSITGWTPLHIAWFTEDSTSIELLQQSGKVKETGLPYGDLKWEGITIQPVYD